MMPLTMAPAGEAVTIYKITGKDEVRQHLGELGLVPGEEIAIVNEVGGNVIISLKSGRVALDKTMTNRIMVEEGGAFHEDTERHSHWSDRQGGETAWRGRGEKAHHGHGRDKRN